MTPLFSPLNEAGRPPKDAQAVLAYDEAGVLCTFKGKNLGKIPFENVSFPVAISGTLPESFAEFIAEPQGLCLSFVVAYSMNVLLPSVLISKLRDKGYEGDGLLALSEETFFTEVLSPYFATAMVDSFSEDENLSFAFLQSRMKKGTFATEYLEHLNALTSLPLGVDFAHLRFGVADRSSLKMKASVRLPKKLALKGSH
jgi:hypothetical protein